MPYDSIDKIQNILVQEVFHYAKDKKKASGRALGTLIEIVTFYTLCAWGLRDAVAIERPAPEFANPDITHNVEFSLHPILRARTATIKPLHLPLTTAKLLRATDALPKGTNPRAEQILSSRGLMRNSAVIAEHVGGFTTAHVHEMSAEGCTIALTDLLTSPFAIFECKRVGVEEGMKKGPQTIEKAKQGAYVARSVSSLQKFRLQDGNVQGVMDTGGGKLRTGQYDIMLGQIINGSDADALRSFILTVGVVSNHGNWFTADDPNKEMKVLAHSYDWLLFLTDPGLCQFIEKLLLNPTDELRPAKDAFLASYRAEKDGNAFTKVKIDTNADQALKRYFRIHEDEVESWFNVIAPKGGTLKKLQADLVKLAGKDWRNIRKS